MKIEATISRGKHKGASLEPWQHSGDYYVLTTEKFCEKYVKVFDLQSVANGIESGLRLRMTNKKLRTSPSMIKPENITIDGVPAFIPE
jgi:hypothetical protein